MTTHAKKERKIQRLIDKLDRSEDVSQRDLRNALGPGASDDFDTLWQSELEQRHFFAEVPDELLHYDSLLKDADFRNNRANSMKAPGKRSKLDAQGRNSKKRLSDDAGHAYENSLETLKELLEHDPSLETWLDRRVRWDPTDDPVPDAEGVPRLVRSKSCNRKQNSGHVRRSKADIKRSMLQDALNDPESLCRSDSARNVETVSILPASLPSIALSACMVLDPLVARSGTREPGGRES